MPRKRELVREVKRMKGSLLAMIEGEIDAIEENKEEVVKAQNEYDLTFLTYLKPPQDRFASRQLDPQYADEWSAKEFIGSFFSLDPCGRYHHILSPNGMTTRCERFWDNLNAAAEENGCWIEGGEGDPTDIFFGCGLTLEQETRLAQALSDKEEEEYNG